MIALVLTVLLGVAAYAFWGNGDTWGGLACVGVIVFVWFAHFVSRRDAKAYVNRVNYWSMDGKDRAKARHRWEEEAREEEKREHEEAVERAERKRGATNSTQSSPVRHDPTICIVCGHIYEETGRKVYSDGTTMLECTCPKCGNRKLWKVEKGTHPLPVKEHVQKKAPVQAPESPVYSAGSVRRTAMEDLFQTNNLGRREELYDCPGCKVKLRIERVNDGVKRKYTCPRCGAGLWM